MYIISLSNVFQKLNPKEFVVLSKLKTIMYKSIYLIKVCVSDLIMIQSEKTILHLSLHMTKIHHDFCHMYREANNIITLRYLIGLLRDVY